MDVLLAERTNDKENQETSTVINKLNAGISILASESFRYHWSLIIIAFQHFFEKFNTFW
jgi:hypothetical protein